MHKSDPNQTGAATELIACAWLMRQGYYVYRNIAGTGPIDIIAQNGKDIIAIDVKTHNDKQTTKYGGPRITAEQASLDVQILLVKEDNTCEFIEQPKQMYKKCAKCKEWFRPQKTHMKHCTQCSTPAIPINHQQECGHYKDDYTPCHNTVYDNEPHYTLKRCTECGPRLQSLYAAHWGAEPDENDEFVIDTQQDADRLGRPLHSLITRKELIALKELNTNDNDQCQQRPETKSQTNTSTNS